MAKNKSDKLEPAGTRRKFNSRNIQRDAKRTAKKALEGIGGSASGKFKSNLELLSDK